MTSSLPLGSWSPAEMFMRKLSEAALAEKKAKLEKEIDDVVMDNDTSTNRLDGLRMTPVEIDGISNDKGLDEIELLASYLLRDRSGQTRGELKKLLMMAVDRIVHQRIQQEVRKELRKWRKIDPEQVVLFRTEKED